METGLNWQATDHDGATWAFQEKPYISADMPRWVVNLGGCEYVGADHKAAQDWKNSCKPVERG